MEENEMQRIETEAVDADQIDVTEGWFDDEPGTEAEGTEAADQPQAGPEEAAPETDGKEAEDETKPEDAPAEEEAPFLTIKHMDESRAVTREEAQVLAQKGLDYDRIREERDQLKTFETEHKAAVKLVEGYAQRMNMTVGQYLDYCRTQELVQGGMGTEQAQRQVQLEHKEAEIGAREAVLQAEQQRQAEAQRAQNAGRERLDRDVKEFMRVYPGVKAADVPRDVFETAGRQGVSLVAAYAMHKAKEAEAALEAERTNAQNRMRSTGSLQKSEAAKPKDEDEIMRDWYSDD